jgi:hypothetical protein
MRQIRSVVGAVLLVAGLTAIASPASAADVTIVPGGLEVTTSGPNMIIRGTPGADIANINQEPDGATSVNGQSFSNITGRVQILLGDGDDSVAINDFDEGFYPSPTSEPWRSLLMATGVGPFRARMGDLAVAQNMTVVGSDQKDSVSISYSDIGGDVRFFLRDNDSTADAVSLFAVDIGGKLVFRQSDGFSRLDASRSTAASTRVFSGKDKDIVQFDESNMGPTQISTANGRDEVNILDPQGDGPIVVQAGADPDTVNVVVPGGGLNAPRPYTLDINMGAGRGDSMQVGVPPNGGDRYVGGAGGGDTAAFCGGPGTGGALVTGFESVVSSVGNCLPN